MNTFTGSPSIAAEMARQHSRDAIAKANARRLARECIAARPEGGFSHRTRRLGRRITAFAVLTLLPAIDSSASGPAKDKVPGPDPRPVARTASAETGATGVL